MGPMIIDLTENEINDLYGRVCLMKYILEKKEKRKLDQEFNFKLLDLFVEWNRYKKELATIQTFKSE